MVIIENSTRSQFMLDTPADKFVITHLLTNKTYDVGLTRFLVALPPYENIWNGGYADSEMTPGLDSGYSDEEPQGYDADGGDGQDYNTYAVALWGGSIYYGLMGDFSQLDPGEYGYKAYLNNKLVQRGMLKIKDHLRPRLNQKSKVNVITYKV